MKRLSTAFTAALLIGCAGTDDPATGARDPLPQLVPGALRAGAAEGTLKLPAGTPLSGFTARCNCLGGQSRPSDQRGSNYVTNFVPSTGHHVRPTTKAVWIENGDEHLVMLKHDVIYSFDGLVEEITRRLEEATGEELMGRVTHSANHNHSSYGTFSKHVGLFLGHDKFNRENFERMVEQTVEVALQAYNNRRDAALGAGWAKDWDPDDLIYSDRRSENRELVVFDDMGPEQGGKDPYLHVLRIDDATTDDPIAVVMGWGMHPYVLGERNSLATADATQLIEEEIAEHFADAEAPVVAMFIQTAGGDAAVRGTDTGWARMETIGIRAAEAVLDLWEAIPTKSGPFTIETQSRSVDMGGHSHRVTRGGEVDWYYLPFDPDESFQPDDEVFDADGNIISPLDEWNTEFGAAFCGSGSFDLPVGGLASRHEVYSSCMQIDLLSRLVLAFFDLSEEEAELPLDGMSQTYTAASRISGVPTRFHDGEEAEEDLLLAFFPGEVTHMYAEMWRRRAARELGLRNTIGFGYSMDHEGYLLVAEDWMVGGYEPDISFHGPLSGEWIMENVVEYSDRLLSTPVKEGFDPRKGPFDYRDYPLPTLEPDLSPDAGTLLTNSTLPEFIWIPPDFTLDLHIDEEVPRINGMIQVAWIGGDPGVDDPRVTLQRENEAGEWEAVRTAAGKELNEDYHDFALTWTPDPPRPASAQQTHYWWAVWQSVGHIKDRAGLPEGRYRLHVRGSRYTGGATTWPWPSEAYEVTSEAFTIVPEQLTLAWVDGSFTASLSARPDGFRLIELDGFSRGHNPVRGPLTVACAVGGDALTFTVDAGAHVGPGGSSGRRTAVDVSDCDDVEAGVRVSDVYGNEGAYGTAPPNFD